MRLADERRYQTTTNTCEFTFKHSTDSSTVDFSFEAHGSKKVIWCHRSDLVALRELLNEVLEDWK